MFRINRIKAIVKTFKGNFGFDNTFDKKINFIASTDNTKGKSSCIESIYYCLGLEELIGGKNEKALKPVFRKSLEYNGKTISVLESEFYLEVENSAKKKITIYRTANKENHKANLITVYYADMDSIFLGNAMSEDMYINSAGAATNEKGFHKFLEEFIGWNLPEVPTYDNVNRKLYLQIVFSALFIEQKRGWSDIFANIPTYLKVRESKKRIVEFLLGLGTIEIEKLKEKCKQEESRIKNEWIIIIRDIFSCLNIYNCCINGLPAQPEILDDDFNNKISFSKVDNDGKKILLQDYIKQIESKLALLNNKNKTVKGNIDDFQIQLLHKSEEVARIENLLADEQHKLIYEEGSIKVLKSSLELINKDLINNKDAKKIKKLGSLENCNINKDICPTCHQKIHDSLLPQNIDYNVMSIDENINHLKSQKSMIEFAISSHKQNIDVINNNINQLEAKIFTMRRVLRSLANDMNSSDDSVSETIVHKKVILQNELEDLKNLRDNVLTKCDKFKQLSNQWKVMLKDKKDIPTTKFTESDLNCLETLTNNFRKNLQYYGYKSITNFLDVEISEDKFIPIIQGFDMKFDSSASDNIRSIWAFIMALMQTSNEKKGNHPYLLIFDEPDQQSVVVDDMKNFLNDIVNFQGDCQVIIGITFKDKDTKDTIEQLDKNSYKMFLLEDKIVKKL